MKNSLTLLTLTLIIAASACRPQTSFDPLTSPAPPDTYTIEARFDRIVIVRLKYRDDMLEGLKKAVKKENIKNAIILSGIGSLTDYHFHTVTTRTYPPNTVYVKDDVTTDLLNVNGYVIDGRIHAHITFSTEKKALGGHLEPGTIVYTFAIITLGVLPDDTNLQRIDDYNWY